jgi:hypothetical protein
MVRQRRDTSAAVSRYTRVHGMGNLADHTILKGRFGDYRRSGAKHHR